MATQLRPFLNDIANAIRTKKGTSGVINAQNFASEIASIPTGGGDNPLRTLVTGKGAYGGYYLCYKYQGDNLDFLNGIDFSVITDMTSMFGNCTNLTTIPQLDTSKVINMSCMFTGCTNLTTIPQLDTSKVISMGSMFYNCYVLQTIDITKLANSNSQFAFRCHSLTKLIIRTMETIPTYGSNMLSNCYHFDGTTNQTYNPDGLKDGRIYVPDDKVDALKAATGWADFADIIVPLSTLVE